MQANRRRRKRQDDTQAQADLTPMIDVTFQLLIFFIVCTRFKQDERNHRADLPKEFGPSSEASLPREHVTIYCQWDEAAQSGNYVLALGARGRKPVHDTETRLEELVVQPLDSDAARAEKRRNYERLHGALVGALDDYVRASGAKIEGLEISFAVNAAQGARSGTAPWAYVSLAVDAAAQLNRNRQESGAADLPVAFKFTDALGRYGQ